MQTLELLKKELVVSASVSVCHCPEGTGGGGGAKFC